MSQHSSLKGSSKISTKRNVLKRYERVDILVKRGQMKKDDVRGFNLPKTKPEEEPIANRADSSSTIGSRHRPAEWCLMFSWDLARRFTCR